MTGQDLAIVAAFGLAIAFAWAAVSKVRDRSGTASAFVGLRVPKPGLAVRVVPALETLVAMLLVAVPVVGALAALVLLAFFTTFLAARLREGVRVSCGCFGGGSNEPLSWLHVARNVALALAALVATSADRPAVPSPAAVSVGVVTVVVAVAALQLAARIIGARKIRANSARDGSRDVQEGRENG